MGNILTYIADILSIPVLDAGMLFLLGIVVCTALIVFVIAFVVIIKSSENLSDSVTRILR